MSSHLRSIIPIPQPQSLDHLKQIHAHLIRHPIHGHHHQTHLTTLVGHCAWLRTPLSYARQLFDSMPQPTTNCFSSMAKLYAQTGSHRDVVALFTQMRRLNITPDAAILPILVKSLGKNATSAHAYIIKSGDSSDRFPRNAMLSFYAAHGDMSTARKMFVEMPDRVVADWNAMLSGYWKWGCKEEALPFFDSMEQRNIVSWTTMVSGLSRMGELEMARGFFEAMPERNVVSWNALLSGYVRNGQAEEGLQLFERMEGAGVRPDETTWVAALSACSLKGDADLAQSLVGSLETSGIHVNCYVRTALIDMYAKCGSLVRARKVFDGAKDRSSVTWNAMIAAYMREGDLPGAKELFDRMPAKDVVSWNSMVTGYVRNGQWNAAIELFKEMAQVKNLKPDEVTLSSVISACGHLGTLGYGKWVVDYIARNRIKLSISGYNAIIFMYSRCGSVEDANKVFEDMSERDTFSYNSLISGLAFHGNGVEVLKLMKRMEADGIKQDNITYIGVLTACSHAGLSMEGCEVFNMIELPTVDHYACKVDLLGRVGRLEEAKRVIEDMPVKPHAGVYGALLNASHIHRCVELGEFAARELFELEPENSGNYVLLSNIYALAGRWQDVENVRKIMRDRGVKKMAGCSWVEFSGEVHRFVAGDGSHCRSEDIYRVLKEIGRKMRELGYVADKSGVTRDVEEEEKEQLVGTHSEKLAVGFGLLVQGTGTVIMVMKNLRICEDCHHFMKMVSEIEGREIVVRDNNRFHCFKAGKCSCEDHW